MKKLVLLFLLTSTTSHAMFWRRAQKEPCVEAAPIPAPLRNKGYFQQLAYKAAHQALHGTSFCSDAFTAVKRDCGSCCIAWIDDMTTHNNVDVELGKNPLDALDAEGYSLLHYAATSNLPDLIAYLSSKGASLEIGIDESHRYYRLFTPLQIAIVHGKKPCMMTLLRLGAKKDGMWDFARSRCIEVQKLYEQADQEVGREQMATYLAQQQRKRVD